MLYEQPQRRCVPVPPSTIQAMKFRRHGVLFLLVILLVPFTTVIIFSGPDLSQEQILQHKIAELRERLHHSEMLHQERRRDVLQLRQQFNLVFNQAQSNNGTGWLGRDVFSKEAEQLLINMTGSLDLQLPSIYHYLPHLLGNPYALQPAFKYAKGRTGVSMVFGVPTVKREIQSYLMTTLQNLIENLSSEEKEDCVIIVFIAETDLDYVQVQGKEIYKQFQEHISTGLLEVIAPSAAFYPDFNSLRQTLGDPMDRVKWRTKQNLDFAFLMMYAQAKGTFYVQLEDDILTKKGYLTTMKKFALQKISDKQDWFILDFCQLGFIGKMFKCVQLPMVVQFFVMFHNDKPVDWLLDHLIQTKVCNLDKDTKHCRKAKDALWIHYKPSLFQHIGTHSSLRGKVQKLKDKQFGKVPLHFPHDNPPAKASTILKPYKTHTIEKAYKGDTFFWGLLPQAGDTVTFEFTPPIQLQSFLLRSGNVEHPNDKFYNTSVEVLPVSNASLISKGGVTYPLTPDGYYVVGKFNEAGVAQDSIDAAFGPISFLRLRVQSESENWVILSEINLVPATEQQQR